MEEKLCQDIPKDVCVTAYNKGFEKGCIKRLAAIYPDLAEHLMNEEELNRHREYLLKYCALDTYAMVKV